jgi:type IV pilus assembly protein PilB
MRASDLHFEPLEHTYRPLGWTVNPREIASPPVSIEKLAARIKVISSLDISEKQFRKTAR